MSSKQDQLYAQLIQQQQAYLQQLMNPAHNAAQQALTNQALDASNWLQGGDYSTLPKGMFFDFKGPQEQQDQYKKLLNVGQTGSFALSNADQGSGMGDAMQLQKNYLSDKFARDASQNYQDNIRNAATRVQGQLGQAAGAQAGNDSQVLSAMNGLGSVISSMPRKQSWWQSLLGSAGGIMGGLGELGLSI